MENLNFSQDCGQINFVYRDVYFLHHVDDIARNSQPNPVRARSLLLRDSTSGTHGVMPAGRKRRQAYWEHSDEKQGQGNQ
jgi:hypothetical protein